jgi:DNA-binding NarL/FixJ family response regulator
MAECLSIVIADDHEIVRSGLKMIIEQEEGLYVKADASCYADLLDLLAGVDIDILILDLNLGDLNGICVLESVANLYPDLPILVLSAYPEEAFSLRAFRAGASGYLNKTAVSSELINAIETIRHGKKYMSRRLQEMLPYGTDIENGNIDIADSLSKREFEVFSLIGQGKSPKEIAQVLSVSPKTVSTYRTRIMEKLMLTNTAQLQKIAYEKIGSSV